jgi:NADPH:quinone reductase-like Zn-dependent oxidoreductase
LEETQKVSRWGSITLKEIDQAKLSEEVVCISLLEVEHEFLATMSVEDMDRLRKITDTVTTLVWLTGGNMIAAPNPDLTLSNGLSRALMLEQPSLQFCVLDVGAEDLDDPETVTSVHSNVERALTKRWDTDDTEFIQLGKSLHVPRFAPDLELNSLFRQRLELNEPLRKATLEEIAPAKLCIGQVGMTDTMHFQQISESPTLPPVGFVEVNLKAISLNAKDIYAMSGRVETRMATTALDIAGVVAAVGPDVKHLKPGDRVAGLAPNHFGTTERVPAASVHKMLAEEEFTVVPTLLTVYSTALFALRDRAGLRKGESILIHAGAGAFGLAGISMAQHIGATVYTTVGSPAKREYLIKEMGVPASNIFNSRDASFVEGIKKATNGRGVDVIVNSLVGDLLHATWACIAHFGRFVEIGKKDLIDAGKLDMHVFLKNTTFTAFDLSEFFYAEDPHYRNVFYGYVLPLHIEINRLDLC